MFGITSSGCFITGIITGFILAFIVSAFCIFYFNPDIKSKVLTTVEEVWKKVKSNVDDSIDAAKNSPTAEPQIPKQDPKGSSPSKAVQKPVLPRSSAPSSASKPFIELKIDI